MPSQSYIITTNPPKGFGFRGTMFQLHDLNRHRIVYAVKGATAEYLFLQRPFSFSFHMPN